MSSTSKLNYIHVVSRIIFDDTICIPRHTRERFHLHTHLFINGVKPASPYARQSFLISCFFVLFFLDYLYKSSTNLFQASGDTVLHAAVRKKDVDIAKLLVEFGCPVDVQNVTTETALSCFHI